MINRITDTSNIIEQNVSWSTFQADHLEREDGCDYEWLDGSVQRTLISMERRFLFIVRNLQDYFYNLKRKHGYDGWLFAEADLMFLKHHRRPDYSWLTDEQVENLRQDKEEVPTFIIEFIAEHTTFGYINDRIEDYHLAGVQVVWLIFPDFEYLYVYTGKRLENARLYTKGEICSAAPALPDFEMPVEAIFEHSLKK